MFHGTVRRTYWAPSPWKAAFSKMLNRPMELLSATPHPNGLSDVDPAAKLENAPKLESGHAASLPWASKQPSVSSALSSIVELASPAQSAKTSSPSAS